MGDEWTLMLNALTGQKATSPMSGTQGPKLDWIIVGGESGAKSKVEPFNVEWARSTVEQCAASGVACFVKQFGSAPFMVTKITNSKVIDSATVKYQFKDSKGGDWTEWDGELEKLKVRQFPASAPR